MKILLCIGLSMALLAGCKSAADSGKPSMDSLNAESKKCIQIANEAEANMNKAMAEGNTDAATAYKATMDSALKANVMIGQQMSELDK